MNNSPEQDSGPDPSILPLKTFYQVLAGGVLVFSGVLIWFLFYAFSPGPRVETPEAVVFIPRGTSSRAIATLLAEQKLINEDIRFILLVRLMGSSANLQAGEFSLHTSQTPVALIRELSNARPIEHAVTIPEGLTVAQTADLLAAGAWVNEDRFLDLCSDENFIKRLGFDGIKSLEGYLFPETYRLVKPPKREEETITMLVEQALSVYQRLITDFQSDLTRHEIFTLASIIEKESGAASERPLIASVFLNRLERRMRLQSDPTVIYGLKEYDGTLTKADLKTFSPFNTYLISGLPPGPIANPGSESIKAVLTPAETDYLYFVSKNNGTHYFSTSYKEHRQAVRKYQRNR